MHRQHETTTQIAPVAERLQVCAWIFVLSMGLFFAGIAVGFAWAVM